MEYREISIIDSGADKYIQRPSDKCLGRQFDNDAVTIRIKKPEKENESNCFMIITNPYGSVIDHIDITSGETLIKQHFSKFSNVKIGFYFSRNDGYVKNCSFETYTFAPALDPTTSVETTPEQSVNLDKVITDSFVDVRWSTEKENTIVFYNIQGRPTHEIEINLNLNPNKVVTVDTNQKITGTKSFYEINIVKDKNIPIYKEKEYVNNYQYDVDSFDGEEQYSFVQNENGYYESNNKGVGNSYAIADIYFDMYAERDLVIEVINSGQDSVNFGVFGKIDQTLSHSTSIDSEFVFKSFALENTGVPTTITYENVPEGSHFIGVKYIKTSDSIVGNDSLQFKILSPIGEIVDVKQEIVGYEENKVIVSSDDEGNLTYNNKRVVSEEEFLPVESLAKGANQAKHFNNYFDFVTAFNSMEKGLWKSGQIFNIVTTKVPDLWVVEEVADRVDFNYTSDSDIVNRLEANGTFQVGYYVFGAMESGKVDLDDYPTKDQMESAINNAITTTINTEV